MHEESWFGPEQTEQNSIDEIAIITFGQLVIVGSRPQIIGPFNNRWKDRTQHMIRAVSNRLETEELIEGVNVPVGREYDGCTGSSCVGQSIPDVSSGFWIDPR